MRDENRNSKFETRLWPSWIAPADSIRIPVDSRRASQRRCGLRVLPELCVKVLFFEPELRQRLSSGDLLRKRI